MAQPPRLEGRNKEGCAQTAAAMLHCYVQASWAVVLALLCTCEAVAVPKEKRTKKTTVWGIYELQCEMCVR